MSEVRILLVEDEGIIAKDLKRRLERFGFVVTGIADTGEDALVLARDTRPDLILMDIILRGGSDGVDAAARILKTIDIPVVFLTSHSDPGTIDRAKLAEPYGYLVKPIEDRELRSTVEIALYRHQAEAAQRVLTRAITASQSGIIVINALAPDYPIMEVNPAFETMTGYAADEAIGRNCRFLAGAETKPEARATIRDALSRRTGCRVTILNYRKDGSKFWNDLVLSPVRDATDCVVNYVGILSDVTRQVLAEEALKERESFLQAIINAEPECVKVLDHMGRLLEMNPAGLRMVEAESIAQLRGEQVLELVVERDRPAFQELVNAVFRGETRELIFEIQGLKGTRRLLETHAVPLTDVHDPSKVKVCLGLTRDVTLRKQAEAALSASRKQLQDIIDSLFGFVGLISLEGRLVEVNEAPLRLLGLDRDEVIGKLFWETPWWRPDPHTREQVQGWVRRAANGEDVRLDTQILGAQGETVHIDVMFGPLRDADGRVSQVLGFAVDITERKRFEVELKDLNAKLEQKVAERTVALEAANRSLADEVRKRQESERRQRALLDSIPFSAWLKDADGRFIAVNRVFAEHWNVTQEWIVDRTDFDVADRARAEAFRQEDERVMRFGEPLHIEQSGLADGTEHWVELVKVPIVDAEGRIAGTVGTSRDITDRKRAEDELLRAKEAAEYANQAKSEFLSRMSHELRTPLNAILGFAQLMETESSEPLQPEQARNVTRIAKAGWHLLSLIDEVLDLAKIEAGKVHLSLEPVNLTDTVEECSHLIGPMAEEQGVRFVTEGFDAPVMVRADATRIKQVLLNLLSNALKYNRDQGEVRLACRRLNNDRVELSVSDTGVGLTDEQLATLFRPFNRLGRETSGIEGTGIGLVITRRLVELMGGAIHVESALGKGTVFRVDLGGAHADGANGNSDERDTDREQRQSRGSYGSATLLYVEDNPSNVVLVQQILARRPQIRLITAHTGPLGLEVALSHRPDLILLDINLPGMDGYEVCARLKEQEATRDIPVIALSANAMSRDIEQGLAAGFAKYLTKPINIPVFLTEIDAQLARMRTRISA